MVANLRCLKVVAQISTFTAARSARYFRDPREFHPERWLPANHPLYDTKYADDNLNAFFPFSLGPRPCIGKEIAYTQTRLFLGKLLWTFDLDGVRGLDATFERTSPSTSYGTGPRCMCDSSRGMSLILSCTKRTSLSHNR
jgi:cytochrome P450